LGLTSQGVALCWYMSPFQGFGNVVSIVANVLSEPGVRLKSMKMNLSVSFCIFD
jgi:hypothetical protein